MALELAGRGWDVAVHYNGSAEAAAETSEACRAHGTGSATLQADLLDQAATEALVPRAAEALGGPLSLLINNASIFEQDTLATATIESWDRHVGSNLRAPFFLSQAFAQQAPNAETDANGEPVARASIVNMIDQRVRKLTPHFATYTLAKAALWTFTQTAAQSLAPHVRVNAIAPGPTLQGARQTAQHFEAQRKATVLGRGANENDIREVLAYLVGAPAVTGQLFCIDGGQHLGWRTPDILGRE